MGFELLPEPLLEDGELYQSVYEPILGEGGEVEAILILETGARASGRLAALSRGLWIATALALEWGDAVFYVMIVIAALSQISTFQRLYFASRSGGSSEAGGSPVR